VDRYSFLVRPLHSLLHAGLSRRTGIGSAAAALLNLGTVTIGDSFRYFENPPDIEMVLDRAQCLL
jgi:hypothetical protein